MLRFRRVVVAIGFLIFLGAFFLIWLRLDAPRVRFELEQDGGCIELVSIKAGKEIHFYEGKAWQRLLFSITSTNISANYRGFEIVRKSQNQDGGIGVELRHYSLNGILPSKVSGRERVVLVDSSGAKHDGVSFQTLLELVGKNRFPMFAAERIFYEFPLSSNAELHFLFCVTNTDGRVTTNAFVVFNPAIAKAVQ